MACKGSGVQIPSAPLGTTHLPLPLAASFGSRLGDRMPGRHPAQGGGEPARAGMVVDGSPAWSRYGRWKRASMERSSE
jgi:hypothetical protein